MTQKISGVVDEITYYSDDSGYGVVKIVPDRDYPQAQREDGSVVAVGTMPLFKEGESVQFTGEWGNHRRYGMQFRASVALLRLPKTEKEIIGYLSSAEVKSVGPETARIIVAHFGEATIDILDEEPERLFKIRELKPEIARRLMRDWEENHVQRHTLIYLQETLGFNARLARRIYSHYGVETRRKINTDPFILAADMFISFKKADHVARKLGVLQDHGGRLRAGLLQALNEFARQGHTFGPRPGVLARAAKLLRLEDEAALVEALNGLLADGRLIEEELDGDKHSKQTVAIYLARYWHAENAVTEKLRDLSDRSSGLIHLHRKTDWASFLGDLGQSENLSLSMQQKNAVRAALTRKVCVLTGGPGTGKTATLRMLVNALRQRRHAFRLAAPTGRAARRLSDATDSNASTIHRLLNWDQTIGGFAHDEGNPLRTDIVVIDETSMVDLLLFNSLLKALQPSTHLLLVGDVDQLPSVGAGNVLRDVIDSGIAYVTRLDKIFRQDANSHIARNAYRINQGQQPIIDNKSSDFFFFNVQDSEKVAENIVAIVKTKVPNKWKFDSARDIQVIAPIKLGSIGVNGLNRRLQEALNGAPKAEVKFRDRILRVGDKVMQTRNDYDKEVFNGDIGFIQSIDASEKSLKVKFDYGEPGKQLEELCGGIDESDDYGFLEPLPGSDLVTYLFSETDDLALAYCVTVHKSQGSEFPVVVMPIHMQQSRMLRRNLLYTAVTRAKQVVVLVGTAQALQEAVANDSVQQRHSGLLHRLRG